MKLWLEAAAQTHVGRVRSNNEDNYYLCGQWRQDVDALEAACQYSGREGEFLAAVADGMGGEDLGEVASLLAVESLRPCPFAKAKEEGLAAVERANLAVCEKMGQTGGGRMGSTLACLYIDGGKALSVNVGDSRVYLLREGTLWQLSVDHSKAQRLIDLGALAPEEAADHPGRHQLTQHLGIFPQEMRLEPAVSQPVALQEGDDFLLCSDGLTDMVPEQEIAGRLASKGDARQIAGDLIQAALDQGGTDNITALVVRVLDGRFLRWPFGKKPAAGSE